MKCIQGHEINDGSTCSEGHPCQGVDAPATAAVENITITSQPLRELVWNAIQDPIKLIDVQKEKAGLLLKRREYQDAVEGYSEAISQCSQLSSADRGRLSARSKAELYHDRAYCYTKLGKLDNAYKDALKCCKIQESWNKGHLQLGELLSLKECWDRAWDAFSAGFHCSNAIVRGEVAKRMFQPSLFRNVSKEQQKKVLKKLKLTPRIRQDVIAGLFANYEWEALEMANDLDMFEECDFSHLRYAHIYSLEYYMHGDPAVQDIVISVLRNGGDPRQLHCEHGDTPMHAAVMITNICFMVTQDMKASSRLLDMIVQIDDLANATNIIGDTVLHTMVQRVNSQEEAAVPILAHVLSYNRVNPLTCDRHGHLASDCAQCFITRMMLIEEEEKWLAKKPTRSDQKTCDEEASKKKRTKASNLPDQCPKNVTGSPTKNTGKMKKTSPFEGPCNLCQLYLKEAKDHVSDLNYPKAIEVLVSIITTKHDTDVHRQISEKAKDILNTSKIIQLAVEKDKGGRVLAALFRLPSVDVRSIINMLAVSEKWKALDAMLAGYIKMVLGGTLRTFNRKCLALEKIKVTASLDGPDDSVACQLNLSHYIRSNYEIGFSQNRCRLLEMMLQLQASPDQFGAETVAPLTVCVEKEDYRSMVLLLQYGASSTGLVVEAEKQNARLTPLAAALQFALKGETEVLDTLLHLYRALGDRCLCPDDPQDGHGNTLFHLAAQAAYSRHALKVVEMLCQHNVNPNLRNSYDNTAFENVKKGKKKDRRVEFIRQHARNFDRVPPKKKQNTTSQSKPEGMGQLPQDVDAPSADDGIRVKVVKPAVNDEGVKQISKEDLLKRIKWLIEELPDYDPDRKKNEALVRSVSAQEAPPPNEATLDVEAERNNAEFVITGTAGEGDTGAVPKELNEEELEEAEELEDFTINETAFDDLEWEVECTSEVWKVLKDKKLSADLKRRIIHKIELLASGEWLTHLCKKLVGVPDTMQLFEAKLSKGSRIVWELAVAFSPVKSETAERRLGLETDGDSGVKGGRIYTEMIRVWDVVLSHDHLSSAIDRIAKSHKRGQHCIIRKKLKGIEKKIFNSSVTKRVPMLFTEAEEDPPPPPSADFFPPASAKETEFHIMKFYTFSTALVNSILNQHDVKVDFPFRVTELEHAIIHLRPNPQCSLILLGRSGTGKTTCCLYRLWSSFIRYWEAATKAGAPLLPRKINFLDKNDEEPSAEPSDDIDEEENSASASVSDDNESCAVCDSDVEEDNDICADAEVQYDHLHQIFITKNPVLCTEVQKTFRELSHAHDAAKLHVEVEDRPLPNRLQEAHEAIFPLFINSQQFLLLLDASLPGQRFFEYNAEGRVARHVKGWMEERGPVIYLHELDDEEEDDEEEEDEEEAVQEDGENEQQPAIGGARDRRLTDPRKYVTYEVFCAELWGFVNKAGKVDYHPSLVWMEITSFILGSVEALHNTNGYLTEQEYISLGRKRAPNFSGDRNVIYKLFLSYHRIKRQNGYFDDSDIIWNLYKRLQERTSLDWVIHEIFIDETQDFTQAELSLLIHCCQNPNNMFFTGDTAQSIMRGIAFRFEDLKSLFFYASRSMKAVGKEHAIVVPKHVYQLTHNYRSHSGILQLAASVVDLMIEFFPESFDRLERDQGLFEGPKPVLLEAYSFSDLALLLCGTKRETSSPIEFGAHQAILVANDAARDQLPPELASGIVLTIFESKGLEFDDVLLYNFFKDSPAYKEWRVVTKHLDELFQRFKCETGEDKTSNLQYIDISVVSESQRPRPLTFDPEQHKVLSSELKYLYTALTRARVNVWLFDEDRESRAPMFEYFRARGLVQCVDPRAMEDSGIGSLSQSMAKTSTPEQWRAQGDKFYKQHLFRVAAKCYSKCDDKVREKMALAHQMALDAEVHKTNPKRLREEFLGAAAEFLDCGLVLEAGKCLYNAKELIKAATVFEKAGQFRMAAKLHLRCGHTVQASQCYEKASLFSMAVETLVHMNHYSEAIDVVQRYHFLIERYTREGRDVPAHIRHNAPGEQTRSIRSLCLLAASHYHNQKDTQSMLDVLARAGLREEEVVDWLLGHGHIDLAAPIMKGSGKGYNIAQKFQELGQLDKALDYVSAVEQPQYRGECLVAAAKCQLQTKTIDDSNKATAIKYAREALDLLTDPNDKVEACHLLATIENHSRERALELMKAADAAKHVLGKVEAYCLMHAFYDSSWLMENYGKQKLCAIELILQLLLILKKQTNVTERNTFTSVLHFFGLKEQGDNNFSVLAREGALFLTMIKDAKKSVQKGVIDKESAMKLLYDHYAERATVWIQECTTFFQHEIEISTICHQKLNGFQCIEEECKKSHEIPVHESFLHHIKLLVAGITLTEMIKEKITAAKRRKNEWLVERLEHVEPHTRWVDRLVHTFFPANVTPWWAFSKPEMSSAIHVLKEIRKSYVATALENYAKDMYANTRDFEKGSNANVHLNMYNALTLSAQGQNYQMLMSALSREEGIYRENKLGRHGRQCLMGFLPKERVSYFRYFVEGEVAFKTGYALHGVIQMNFFILHLSRHARAPIMPSIAHVMQIAEFNYTILQALFMCANKDGHDVVLPRSYIAAIRRWDALKKGGPFMESCINKSKIDQKQSKDMRAHMGYLAAHMCGNSRINFNMLADAFCGHEKLIRSGETERVLILVLVMLCNTGKMHLMGQRYETLLQTALANIDLRDEDETLYPRRVVEAVRALHAAKSRRMIGNVLNQLLISRNEVLFCCNWSKTQASMQLYKFGPARIEEKTFARIILMKSFVQAASQPVEEEVEPPTDDLINSALMEQARIDEDKRKAAECIQRAYRRHLFRKQLEARRKQEESKSVSIYTPITFNRYVDDTMCGLCNFAFENSKEKVKHLETFAHKQQHQEFTKLFMKAMNEEMIPSLVNFDEFVTTTEQELTKLKHTAEEFNQVLSKLNYLRTEVVAAVGDIEKTRHWGTVSDLKEKVKKLNEEMKLAGKTLANFLQEEAQRQQQLLEQEEVFIDDSHLPETDDIEESQDDIILPIVSTKPVRKMRGRRSKDKRRR